MYRAKITKIEKYLISTLLVFTGTALSQPVQAGSFSVDQNFWGTSTDVGTLSWAINQANTNPGLDTINITPNLEIDVDNGDRVGNRFLTRFTESAIIQGNGAKLIANPTYVTSGGLLATKTNIVGNAYRPPIIGSDVVVVPGVSFAEIGAFGQDNSGINVEFRNLHADGLGSIAAVNENANLSISGSDFTNIVNYTQSNGRVALEAFSGSTLSLDGISLNLNFPFGDPIPITDNYVAFSGSISGSNSILNLQNSTISDSYGAGAILWVGGTANVVSSIISNSGGIQIQDSSTQEGTLNLVNSILALNTNSGETLQETSRILSGNGGEANISASSILLNSLFLSGEDTPFDFNGAPLTAALNGTVNLNSSVVSILNWNTFFPSKNSYSEFTGGALTAGDYTFITPTVSQDRAALQALFNNANILTDGNPYALLTNAGVDFYEAFPDGATPLVGGPLVSVVPDAGMGGINELINPITGLPITTDVFGNPRVNAQGFRDIGAVQVPEPSTIPAAVVGLTLLSIAKFRKRKGQFTNHD